MKMFYKTDDGRLYMEWDAANHVRQCAYVNPQGKSKVQWKKLVRFFLKEQTWYASWLHNQLDQTDIATTEPGEIKIYLPRTAVILWLLDIWKQAQS